MIQPPPESSHSPCGTYNGAQRHYRLGEPPCDQCREARNAYMREHRRANKSYQAANAARHRALTRLARLHPDEYLQLLDEEKGGQ